MRWWRAQWTSAATPINTSRFLFGEEPLRVSSLLEKDPTFQTDRLTSALLEFPSGHAMFTCSTQLVPHQRMQLLGTRGRLEIEISLQCAQ